MSSLSEELAAFATDLSFEALPEVVIGKVKLHVLDLLGVALAANEGEFGAAAMRLGRSFGGSSTCTILGAASRLPAEWAALVNGTLAHGLDFDDTHSESVVHVSASVVPAALALCEETVADGKKFVTAVAAGMETNIRIGLACPGDFHDRGFHPTGVCGAHATALLAARLIDLPPEQVVHALGIAGSQAAGTMQFLDDGAWVKRFHPGWAAHAGLVAARAAAAGFSGPRRTFEGRFGLYATHLGHGDRDLSALTAGLGASWQLLDIALKPYPCCHMNHAFIDCAAALREMTDLRPEAIERVECFIHPREVPVVCEPLARKQAPQSDYDAKFSLPYAVACMLLRGHVDVDDFSTAAIADPAVRALALRVAYREDAANEYPRYFPGWLRLHLRDGRVLEQRQLINRGSPTRPLTTDEVYAKFRRNARRALPAEQVDAIVRLVGAIEQQPDLSVLAAALRRE